MKNKRIINLDLFRSIAILFVIIFHTTQMYANNKFSANYYSWGKFGVEFFFVLSGFLVGGLFYKQTVKVNLLRFWLQRFFRTYPPYIIALLLNYFAVYQTRNEHFNIGYLIFFQNFYTSIPYFKISWSLCIEEHFYIAFPLFIIISEKFLKEKKYQLCFWIFLCILPTIIRWRYGSSSPSKFGYYETASYFRFEGIAMGCLLSFLVYRLKFTPNFSFLAKLGTVIFFLSMLFINVIFKNSFFTYTLGYLFLNCSLLLLLTLFYFSNSLKVAAYPMVFTIASMAYSLYLTHALTINAMAIISTRFKVSTLIMYPLTITAIFIVGYIFYKLIEQPTIRYRNLFLNTNKLKENKFNMRFFGFKKSAL